MPSSTIACGGLPTTSTPSNSIEPDVGTYTPVIWLKNVVLPAPFGPMRRDDRAARDREVDVVGRDEAAELLAHVLGDEQVVRSGGHQSSDGSRSVSVPSVWTS